MLAYAEDVLEGRIVAGPHVRNACRRHIDDLTHGPRRGLTWDLEAAQYTIGFYRDCLRLNTGQFEGLPFELHPSQAFIVGSVFGWKRPDGTRRFRRVYIEEGKGNGKSPLAAGIGIYCLVADDEARAEVYAAASKKDQAMVLFRDAVAMVDQATPALRGRIHKSGIQPVWNLADLKHASFFRPISAEDGQSGPRPSCALCDEVHEHHDGETISMLEKGFKFRRQPILVMITNSGSDRNSVCWQEHQHAVRVAAGTLSVDEGTFSYVGDPIHDEEFAYVCALDAGDDPLEDETCWAKANPLLDVIVDREKLRAQVRQAKMIPGQLNKLLRLNFCIWTDAETAWMSRPTLERVLADFDPEELHQGAEVCVGVDLSASQDLTALGFLVRTGTKLIERPNQPPVHLPTFDGWIEAWTPEETLAARELRDQQPYKAWVDAGWLHAIPGPVIRLDFVAARLAEIGTRFRLRFLAYDGYAYKRFSQDLDQVGVTVTQLEHPQGGVRRARAPEKLIEEAKREGRPPPEGLWMPGSVASLETIILEERIRLRRSPVLASAFMGAVTEHDAFNNRWFSKRKATIRIDPLVSITMATGAALFAPPTPTSAYEKRGILVL